MADILICIYRFANRRRLVFYLLSLVLTTAIVLLATRISFEEDISGTFAGKNPGDKVESVIKNLKSSDKIIVDITQADSLSSADPAGLEAVGDRMVDSLNRNFDTSVIRSLLFRASDTTITYLTNLVNRHLPSFLDASDYLAIDSLLLPASIERAMENNYRILVSPASMVMKKRIRQDPLGIANLAYEKLKSLNTGGNFTIHNGCVYSKDLKHLYIFIQPSRPASETAQNDKLITGTDRIIEDIRTGTDQEFNIRYFGGPAVAVSNARQLKKDIALTLLIAFSLIFILTGWYFRSIKVPLLGLLPALFGGALSLAILFMMKGSISAISLGIGSVILGLIIDYSLYLLNHFRKKGDIELALKEMSLTIVLCSLTTAGAFLCLTFLQSIVLQDLGWFAAISVAGAALFTLTILPGLVDRKMFLTTNHPRVTFIDRIASVSFEKKKWLVAGLGLLLLPCAWFAGRVEFEKDMSALSFVTPELEKAESDLDKITSYKLKNLFLVATGKNIEEALRNKEQQAGKIAALQHSGIIKYVSDAGSLLASDSLQLRKIAQWNDFWNTEKKAKLFEDITLLARKNGFQPNAFEPFFNLLDNSFSTISYRELQIETNPILADWVSVTPGLAIAPIVLKVREADKTLVYRAFPASQDYVLFDRQNLTSRFIESVRQDFDLLVTLSMAFVTLLLIVSFGRLGLGLITALPMYLSWLVTLGFMGFAGIRLNIFNIIVSSFIFGLGVDYSILMMRGLQYKLRTGTDDMPSYKVSVMLSSLTTLFGVGALFFAQHPALKSIALVSVIGISAVVVTSFIVQPLLFNWLVLSRLQRRKFPVTFRIMIKTFVTWGNIVMIAIVLMILGSMINLLLPVKRKKKEMIFHQLFYRLCRAYIAFTFANDRKLINTNGEDFSRPAIIISNHQSLIETPAFLRLHPKIIILTRTWVYKSPVFGPIARLANYYNVDNGIENILEPLRKKVEEGFSILIFPEGHRSDDQHIQRFHRGAFFLAEKLELDILPIVVFGTGDFLGRGAFWGKPNSFRMKILNRVPAYDRTLGTTYQERSKQFRQFYIREFAKFRAEEGDAHYYRRLLALNYVLKGPVLEWYMRVKLKLENNYELYNRLMPRQGNILDLGCGYGFISYMLMFTGEFRQVTGVDYDAEKIRLAENCFSKNDRIGFVVADVSTYEITPHNGFVISDMLHYLEPAQQDELLRKCCQNLLPGGTILVREANAELTGRHKRARITEFFSTRTGFNKTGTPGKELHFTSAGRIREIAGEQGLTTEIIDNKKITSNNLFVLKRLTG